jgi:hypothetical protein
MRAFLLVLLVLAAACESKEAKYERLQTELAMAESPLRYAEKAGAEGKPQCPELVSLPTNEYLSRCTDQLSEARTRVAMLQRELNQFMAGR